MARYLAGVFACVAVRSAKYCQNAVIDALAVIVSDAVSAGVALHFGDYFLAVRTENLLRDCKRTLAEMRITAIPPTAIGVEIAAIVDI